MSALDLLSGYFQMAVNPSDIVKTAFVTKNGTYAFRRMPFGLSGAAPNFQKAIDIILKPVIGKFVNVYLNDVIISPPSFTQHGRLTINVDQVQYIVIGNDETDIGTGGSDNGSLRDESSGFDRVQRRSNESRDGKKKGSERGRHNKEDQFDPEKAEKGSYRPYIKERTKSSNKNARRGGDQQRQDQERRGTCTKKSLSLEVLVGNANYKS
ncbi:transposon Ty3-I Gag-Pol polyprotein [Trichonephila clavipes]|nr:transposon Ty3-I Gag-Pol polyprotein [Trichonephila clavipes]